jgi:predicted aspartyl protease
MVNPRLAAIATLLSCMLATEPMLAAPLPQAVTPSLGPQSPTQTPAATDHSDRVTGIIADVMIDGRGPFHFMLDTGATQAVIADSTVARLGLRPDSYKVVRVQGVNARVLAPEVHIDSLTISALQFRSIDLPVLSGSFFDGVDGILSAQGFGRIKVSVSLLDRRCIIATSPRRADTAASATAVRLLSRQLPMVSATLAGIKVQVIIDTGATNTLGNMALLAALQKVGAMQARGLAPAQLDVTPVRRKGLIGVTAPLQVGQVMIQPPQVTFDDYQIFQRWNLSRHPAVLLGMDALSTLATFSIDYGRQQVQLIPRPTAMLSDAAPLNN